MESNDALANSTFSSRSLSGRKVRAPASKALGREFYSEVLLVFFRYVCHDKLAASSSRGDFEACVNLLQACFTLAVLSCQPFCKLTDLQWKLAGSLMQTKIVIWVCRAGLSTDKFPIICPFH
ncbi:hypothetical protein AVEN_74750-1 [Araneus ventricosus]|uniref:Uncharacterized protein n=1 Tax=Araneus ventricosus TaxID=182803 RepID=A0A4Y2UTE5_ARAVE|nr:hypothetical protein AVEN_37632-1 [Araneus ventricosus]GBO16270.1 hypothetical protein AVEN_74750-1 [Araneus ventricosus]